MGMNERIKELSLQAKKDATENFGVDFALFFELYEEKFAELIVRECAGIIESQDVDPAFRHRMAWAVKQRFGVE
jgi:hypothetical protein